MYAKYLSIFFSFPFCKDRYRYIYAFILISAFLAFISICFILNKIIAVKVGIA